MPSRDRYAPLVSGRRGWCVPPRPLQPRRHPIDRGRALWTGALDSFSGTVVEIRRSASIERCKQQQHHFMASDAGRAPWRGHREGTTMGHVIPMPLLCARHRASLGSAFLLSSIIPPVCAARLIVSPYPSPHPTLNGPQQRFLLRVRGTRTVRWSQAGPQQERRWDLARPCGETKN